MSFGKWKRIKCVRCLKPIKYNGLLCKTCYQSKNRKLKFSEIRHCVEDDMADYGAMLRMWGEVESET